MLKYVWYMILSWVGLRTSSSDQSICGQENSIRPKKIHVYDAFTFTNELETLIIRLYELYPVVHKFVIVEASETFTGLKRDLIYEKFKNDKRFQPFQDSILYHICNYPDNLKHDPGSIDSQKTWGREHYTRNHCIREALDLAKFQLDDLLLLGDVDEIPSRESIDMLSSCHTINGHSFKYLNKQADQHKHSRCYPWISYQTNRLHFNFHCQSENMAVWPLPRIVFGNTLNDWKVQQVRGEMRRNCKEVTQVPAGWHLSNFYYSGTCVYCALQN